MHTKRKEAQLPLVSPGGSFETMTTPSPYAPLDLGEFCQAEEIENAEDPGVVWLGWLCCQCDKLTEDPATVCRGCGHERCGEVKEP